MQAIAHVLRECRGGFIAVVIFSIITQVMEHYGWLNTFKGTDAAFRARVPNPSVEIFIVEIKEKDYLTHFEEKSPLPAERVKDLIKAVSQKGPLVIGVDIDTTSGNYQLDPAFPSNVIWAQVPNVNNGKLEPRRILSGAPQPPPEMTGVPLFEFDSDGVVRRYKDRFEIESPPGHIDSLAHAVFKYARKQEGHEVEDEEGDESLLLNFAGDRSAFPIYSASAFLDHPSEALLQSVSKKIVLIGGAYAAARDEYLTPRGPMYGVELIAHAIQSDYAGGVRELEGWRAIAADLIVGCIIVLVFHFLPFRWAFWMSLVMLAGLFTGSVFSFKYSYFMNFAPIMFGVFLHQVYEAGARKAELAAEPREHELEHHLALARRRVRTLEQRLKQNVDVDETEL